MFDKEKMNTHFRNYNHLGFFSPFYFRANNELIIKGVQSEWFCFSPYDKGVPKKAYGCQYTPIISDHKIRLK